jgi:hypothetical protein
VFAHVLLDAGLHDLVDIRSFPGSRRKPVPGSPHLALRHPSSRADADYMDAPEFVAGIDELLARGTDPTVMCSESVWWWRCHRRLVADYVTLVRDVPVEHLMHDGRCMAHRVTDGVRRDHDRLVYDLGVTSPVSEVGC